MFRKIVFYDHFTDALTEGWKTFMLQGVLLLALGALVLIVPQLLAVMVATTFFFLGALFVVLALKTRSCRQHYRIWRREFWEP